MACSIVLIAFHGDPWIPRCLSTLADHVPAGTHLLLVDNSGNRGIATLDLSHFDAEIIRAETPLGFAAANNLALTQATRLEPAVAFLNQDTLSSDDWLSACLTCLAEYPDVGAMTPLTRTYDSTGWDPYFLECARKSWEFAQAFDTGQPYEPFYSVPVIPAAAMVMRTDLLQQVGPFDPIFGSYYEDYDLCYRIRKAGYRVGVCPAGSIGHHGGSATQTKKAHHRRARWIARNRVIFLVRTSDESRASWFFRYMFTDFIRGFGRSLFRRPMAKPLGAYVGAHLDLLRLLPRLISEERDWRCWAEYLDSIGWERVDSVG